MEYCTHIRTYVGTRGGPSLAFLFFLPSSLSLPIAPPKKSPPARRTIKEGEFLSVPTSLFPFFFCKSPLLYSSSSFLFSCWLDLLL